MGETRARMRAVEEYQGELASGLRWLHLRTTGRVGYAAVMIGIGSRDERPGEWGLAHLIEHMYFKGTAHRNAYQVTNRVEGVGASFNAYTASEETVLHSTFMPRDLARILELLADVVCHASFPAHELEREREVIMEEYASYRDSPVDLLVDDFEDRIFAGHPLGHNILGTPREIRRFTRAHILSFLGRYFNPGRVVVCTAGPFGPGRIATLVSRYFGEVPDLGADPRPLQANCTPAQCWSVRKRTAQAHCLVGAQTLDLRANRQEAERLNLLLNILGGPASTCRLNRRLREHEGLAYTVDLDRTSYLDAGTYTIYFGTDPQHINRCVDIILRELRRLREDPLSTMQLHMAKRQFMGQTHLAMDSIESLLVLRGRQVLDELPAFHLEETEEIIRETTAHDLQELAEAYMRPEQLFTLIYT